MIYHTIFMFSLKCVNPAYRKQPLAEAHEEEATIYISEACTQDGCDNAQAGIGVWFGPDNPNNISIKVPGQNQSKRVSNLVAVLHAVQKAPPFAPLHILSSSKYVIEGLTQKLKQWEEHGWINVPNQEFIKPLISNLRARGAITTFKRVTGHMGIKFAKSLASEGMQKPQDYPL
jgi:ribonuclease HI